MDFIKGYFDGACEPFNPGGDGTYGVVLKVNGRTVFSDGFYIGSGGLISNNVAEYAACIHLLSLILKIEGTGVVLGDSKLVINQLCGTWAVHGGLYVPYYRKARALADRLRDRIDLKWIPREQNTEADRLSKKLLAYPAVRRRVVLLSRINTSEEEDL